MFLVSKLHGNFVRNSPFSIGLVRMCVTDGVNGLHVIKMPNIMDSKVSFEILTNM
jgi:hypothetical protein